MIEIENARVVLRRRNTEENAMYRLKLTHGERMAIDWIGNRYENGFQFYKLLCQCETEGEREWDEQVDITFSLQEHLAWELGNIRDESGWACFSDEFRKKLNDLLNSVV